MTDHKLILSPRKGIPSLAAARLQRWAIILSAYQYQIEYKCTKDYGNVDRLSRLPIPTVEAQETPAVDVFTVAQLDSLPAAAEQPGKSTQQDPLLSKVRCFTKSGWPQEVKGCLKPYWNRRHELSVEGDCVLWGIQVIVPKKLQNEVLMELHREHQGIARMKAITRSYVWWPGLDKLPRIAECASQSRKPCGQVRIVVNLCRIDW